MPKRADSYWWSIYNRSSDYRQEAEKWEHVAATADADGDTKWAEDARAEAATIRQRARELEADARGHEK